MGFTLAAAGAAPAFATDRPPNTHWVDSWSAVPDSPGAPFAAQTVRQIVRLGIGGSSVRLRLSNLFGAEPVTIGPVHVAEHATGSAIRAGTDHVVTFHGRSTVAIGGGADAVSDPVAFSVRALEELAVSLYLPMGSGPSTIHSDGKQTAFISFTGDATAAAIFPDGESAGNRFFLTDVEVAAQPAAAVLVTIGDSITDGSHSTPNLNARWPDILATRAQSDPKTASVAVVNSGISGNRILHDGFGPSLLSRFDRDALGKSGVKWVMILEGINDIGIPLPSPKPEDAVTAQQLIDGLKQLIAHAHERGIRVLGGTLTPFGGTNWPYHSMAGEAKRQALNAWIRTGGAFDAVVDFENMVRDPAHPDQFLPAFDCGDHLHPNDAGYKTMGDGVDLRLLIR